MTNRIFRYGVIIAIVGTAACGSGTETQTPAAAEGTEKPQVATPRTPDGKPDLSGRWGGGGGGGGNATGFDAEGNYTVVPNRRKNNPVNTERDAGMGQRFETNLPVYKPEFWERVDYLDNFGNKEDPAFHCMPEGVPRMGAPTKIVQTANEVIFLYGGDNTFRVIPTDGRPHHPVNSKDQTLMGDSVGKWEGDTLVIDVVGFSDVSWLDWPGYFHTNKMRVTERLRREGNTLHYQATVEDPDVLQKPWVMNPVVMQLNTNPNAIFIEDPFCMESDGENLVTRERG